MNIKAGLEEVFHEGYEQGYNDATEWISVKDRLPENSGNYLVWCGYYSEIAFYMDWCHKWKLDNLNPPTHWMPLPKSPKGV